MGSEMCIRDRYRADPPSQPWNNLNSDETREAVEGTLALIGSAIDLDLLNSVPISQLNGINNSLNQFNQHLQNVKTLQPQQQTNQHHHPLNQLNSVDSQIRSSGLYSLIKLSPDLDKKTEIIDSQIEIGNKAAAELENLTEQVRELLNPAVAGNISNAFEERKKKIAWQKWFWFLMLFVSGAVSISLTIEVTDFLTNLYKNADETNKTVGLVWFLRLLLLLPGYFFIGFSVSQFLRERRYEENYAHKASVAQTLPSYSELISNTEVRDQITSSATKIVFAPPYSENKSKPPKKGLAPSEIKDVADAISSIKLPGS